MTAKYSERSKVWSLMVKTHGGKVSIMQGMDAPTARGAYQHLKPGTRPVERINLPESGSWSTGGMYQCSDNSIDTVEIIGPAGAKLDPWKGVEPEIIDMAPERERQRLAKIEAGKKREKAEQMAKGANVFDGLNGNVSDRDFRCSCCNKMRDAGTLMFYIDDHLKPSDPPEKFVSAASNWNRNASGWCVRCVPKNPVVKKALAPPLTPTKPLVQDGVKIEPKRSWLERAFPIRDVG